MGYDGIVITDAMDMDAITENFDPTDAAVMALGSEDDAIFGGDATAQIAELLKDHPDCESHVYEAGYGHASYDLAPDYKDRMQEFFSK